MPKFFKLYLSTLTDKQADKLLNWFNSTFRYDETVFDILLKPRPKLHKRWKYREMPERIKVFKS